MVGEDVINPAPDAQRATVTGGESKRIRFLSPTVAVVDGTEEISSIPRAHGFSPRELRGVYTTVWVKNGEEWEGQAARAWF